MVKTYGVVLPRVHRYLSEWKDRARGIPDPELRKQALMSIDTKTFHCEGGSLYGLLAGAMKDDAIRFIVAYQTVSEDGQTFVSDERSSVTIRDAQNNVIDVIRGGPPAIGTRMAVGAPGFPEPSPATASPAP